MHFVYTADDTDGSEDYAEDVCSSNDESECSVPMFEDNQLVDPDVPLIEQE